MCFHKYKYIGSIRVGKWLGGVVGGTIIETSIYAKKCQKCGKIKEVNP